MRFVLLALFGVTLTTTVFYTHGHYNEEEEKETWSTSSEESSFEQSIFNEDPGQIWAVLVAGSNGWYNYRHQADTCHAYQVLRAHGVPTDHIIHFAFDDIANNKQNPYKGKIYNKPNGPNVYEGCVIDYKGKDNNVQNFIAVITGEKKAVVGGSGRVLESTSNDKVFINYADHGGTGVIIFPNEELTAHTLNTSLQIMYSKKMYNQLTFYLEACESGSMFDKILPDNINIYAATAANPNESSWGCYCDGPSLPCLGDTFSVSWMEDADAENLRSETLHKQFDLVKERTNQSHVCKYGDYKDIWEEYVAQYLGNNEPQMKIAKRTVQDNGQQVNTRDIPIHWLTKKRDSETNERRRAFLTLQIDVMQRKRRFLEMEVEELVRKVVESNGINDKRNIVRNILVNRPKKLHQHLKCHHNVIKAFSKYCFNMAKNPYSLKYAHVFANMCELGLGSKKIVRTMIDHCASLTTMDELLIE